MPTFEEIRDSYKKKLDQIKEQKDRELEADLKQLQEKILSRPNLKSNQEIITNLIQKENRLTNSPPYELSPHNALLSISDSYFLKELDDLFIQIFNFSTYYSPSGLRYNTIYCDTPEEFYGTFLLNSNYSETQKKELLDSEIRQAMKDAIDGGGCFGVSIPGVACYINGWLISTLAGIDPKGFLKDPDVLKQVKKTTVHEKLGHGFLSFYSELGRLEESLGLTLIQIASRFPHLTTDDATDNLKYEQSRILFGSKTFLEEGWATWIQKFYSQNIISLPEDPPYSVNDLIKPLSNYFQNSIIDSNRYSSVIQALSIILDENTSTEDLRIAIKITEDFDNFAYRHKLSFAKQPFRYGFGNLILQNCERNLGTICVPYAALIAANVTFNPEKVGVSDLSIIMADPRYRPNTRLVMISKLKLREKNNIQELAERVSAELSLSIPAELKK